MPSPGRLRLSRRIGHNPPALKNTGEWILYLKRDCRFLDPSQGGKCTIHGASDQSLICKTYDPRNCWYTRAFRQDDSRVLIPFDTEGLIRLERDNTLIQNRFSVPLPKEGLHRYAAAARALPAKPTAPASPGETPSPAAALASPRLSHRASRRGEFLFFPPFTRPQSRNQFSLLTFRLGFPGVTLAAADNGWAFLVESKPDPRALELIRREYYPPLAPRDFLYSFQGIQQEWQPFSETGAQWVILGKKNLPLLESLTRFDEFGKVTRHASTGEILKALTTRNPDRAA